MRLYLVVLVLTCYGSASSNVWADLPLPSGANPASANPGAILQYNTRPWAIPTPTPNNDLNPSNQSPERESVPEPSEVEYERNQPIPVTGTATIFVEQIIVENCTLLSPKKIQEVIAPYEHTHLTFQTLQKLTEALTDLYVQAGYINSEIYLPPQNFENNQLILKAFEVKVDEVVLEKTKWFSTKQIRSRILPEPGSYFNVKSLSRSIRLINENPDIVLKASLKAGEKTGTTRIHLESQTRFPIHLTPYWDNLGRESIGFQRFGVTATHNNLSGMGDTLTASWSASKRSQSVVNQYSLPVGAHGTKVGLDFAYSKVRIGGELRPLEIVASSRIFSPVIQQTLWNNDRFGMQAGLAFDFKDLNTDLLKEPFQKDSIRLIRPSISGYLNDKTGRFMWNQEIGIGVPGFGGSTGDSGWASKSGSGTRFLRLTGGVTRIQALPLGTTGVLRARYQYSPDRLVSVEQFQIGGAYSVRGYTEGNSIGDSGYVLNAEFYAPFFFFLKQDARLGFLKPGRHWLDRHVQLVGFSDFGQVYVNQAVSGEFKRTKLLSAGVGLRVQLNKYLVLRADAGFPLLRQTGALNNPRLHFGLQSSLF